MLIVERLRGRGGLSVELPAALVGDTGDGTEEMAAAAGRELVEETSYEAQEIVQVAAGPSSPGLTSEYINIFLATRLRKVGPGGGDESEEITLYEVPLAEVEDWLAERIARGLHVDLKVYAGLYFARRVARAR
jgi:ADP-ribose pyrophosphatase